MTQSRKKIREAQKDKILHNPTHVSLKQSSSQKWRNGKKDHGSLRLAGRSSGACVVDQWAFSGPQKRFFLFVFWFLFVF